MCSPTQWSPAVCQGSQVTTPAPVVTLLAPAKLTLYLRMTGLRDDGYHLIDAEMVTVDLADTVEIDH